MKENIQELTLTEHIRKRPAMYLGTSDRMISLLKGLINNCLATVKSDACFFHITIRSEYDLELTVKSNGDISAFTNTFEQTAFDFYYYRVLEAVSEKLIVKKKNTSELSLRSRLDATFIETSIDYWKLIEVVSLIACLNRTTEIRITDNRAPYPNLNYFAFPQGIKYLYDRSVAEATGKPEFELAFDGELNGLFYQVFLGYRTDWFPQPHVISFANDIQTTGGSLIDGITEGLIDGCRWYVKAKHLEHYSIRKAKFSNGLILVASVKGDDFTYDGSIKETLTDNRVRRDIKKIVRSMVLDFMYANPEKAHEFLWRFDTTRFANAIY
jgi:DNA gyrase/topoisomerase IV subunit B